TAAGGGIALVEPFLVNMKGRSTVSETGGPLPTQTAHARHFALAEPFILNRHGDNGGYCRASSMDDPAPTTTARGGGYVVEPFMLSQASGGAPRATGDPVPTIPAGGA